MSVNRLNVCFVALGTMLFAAAPARAQRCRFTDHSELKLLNSNRKEQVYNRENLHISVVFNILYQNESENISENQILSQLEVLNEDYSASNADRKQLSDHWKRLSADAGIQFCLYRGAEAPNGIRRKKVSPEMFGDSFSLHFTQKGGLDALLPAQVLNVWVFSLDEQIAGYTNPVHEYPLSQSGVVLDPRFVGRLGSAIENAPYNLGRTLTHEIGHFFGLRHVWGNLSGECSEDDGVEDTPLQSKALYGCPEREEGCGTAANVNNFMNLVDDPCLNMFTPGQVARMRAYIQEYLPEFGQSTACKGQSISYQNPIQGPFVVFPNPSHGDFILQNTLNQDIQFSLIDLNGKTLVEGVGNEAFFPIQTALPPGIYLLRVQAKTGNSALRVVVR